MRDNSQFQTNFDGAFYINYFITTRDFKIIEIFLIELNINFWTHKMNDTTEETGIIQQTLKEVT